MNDAGRISFVIKGVYNNTETYDFLDVVYYNNSSYVAKKLTVGNPPADNNEYWQALAKVPVSAVLGVKGNAESAYRTGNINLTAENVGAVNKGGDTIPGRLNFINSADLRFMPPDVTGDHARGMVFMDKNGTGIWGGIGVLGRAGEPQYIYVGAGTPYPWDSSQGLYISNANILWKGAKLVTENSGNALSATKATQDGNGNVITDTYAKKEWTEEPAIAPGEKNAYRNGYGVVDMIIMPCNYSSELFVYNTFSIPNPYERCGEGRSGMYLYFDKEQTESVYMRRGSSAIVFDNNTSNTLRIFTKK